MSAHEQFISDEELKRIKEKIRGMHEMGNEISRVTDVDFNDLVNKNMLALIDFWASWCGPCRALAPTIEELAKDYAGRAFVGKLDVDENPTTAERFQVFSIPTVLIMKSGREVERIVGCVPKDQIETALKKHLG